MTQKRLSIFDFIWDLKKKKPFFVDRRPKQTNKLQSVVFQSLLDNISLRKLAWDSGAQELWVA